MRMSLSVASPTPITLQDSAYRGPNSGKLDSQRRVIIAPRPDKSSTMQKPVHGPSEPGSPPSRSSRQQQSLPPDSQQDSTSRDPLREGSIGMAALLPGIHHWQHSEEGLTEALRLRSEAVKLRAEQERTRQESLRLEGRRQIMEIMETALRAGVPGPSIPLLFGEQNMPTSSGPAGPTVTQGMMSPTPLMPARPAPPVIQTSPPALASEPGNEPRPPITMPRYRGHHRGQSTPSFPIAFSTTAGSAQRRPVTQGVFPPPHRQSPTPGSQGGPSQDLQIHQWRPSPQQSVRSQTRERSNSSPKRDFGNPPGAERPTKLPAINQHPGPPPPATSPQNSPAQVVANQNQARRRMGHARHRSDITDLRGFHVPDDGVKILANAASERSKQDGGTPDDRSKRFSLPPNLQSAPIVQPMQAVQQNQSNSLPDSHLLLQTRGESHMGSPPQAPAQQQYQPQPPSAPYQGPPLSERQDKLTSHHNGSQ